MSYEKLEILIQILFVNKKNDKVFLLHVDSRIHSIKQIHIDTVFSNRNPQKSFYFVLGHIIIQKSQFGNVYTSK
jgi:hypothetical protein